MEEIELQDEQPTGVGSSSSDDGNKQTKVPIMIFVSAFFMIVASVLGTGILGLPVSVASSGLPPFIVSYSICLIMQALVIMFTIELLQRGRLLLGSHDSNTREGGKVEVEGPDLHTLGTLYLSSSATRYAFDIGLILHLVSVLISYALAGSQAYGQMLKAGDSWLPLIVTVFVTFFTLLIIFSASILHYIISVMTLAKGNLLVFLVVITGIVSAQINNNDDPINTRWIFVGDSLLISTVALGGSIAILPVIFSKVGNVRRDRQYRFDIVKLNICCVLALFVVFVLNIIWCYYVLHIVPYSRDPDYSLVRAKEDGKIATYPLIGIINRDFGDTYVWAAVVVNLFIVISITVSYITLGAGMKHILDGLATTWQSLAERITQPSNGFIYKLFCWPRGGTTGKRVLIYIVSYGAVLVFAALNPRSFLIVIESVTSFSLNLTGTFVAWMLGVARKRRQHSNDEEEVVALPNWLFSARWIVMFYFSFAMFYDIASIFSSFFVS
eukprot:TRINITY_DN14969_c0_g1_i1.p1 TRINITY_DN14969_c0_g1~~TRINITY_DN14969_c0_g1_i1.p1  ORF type:complete len:497 (-),score=67.93 TRINITY_DN14969_c0_g1_i1:95-1585(-)